MTSRTDVRYYLDTSVAIHVLDGTARAATWFDAQVARRRLRLDELTFPSA